MKSILFLTFFTGLFLITPSTNAQFVLRWDTGVGAGITVDSDEFVWVAGVNDNLIYKFDQTGTLISQWGEYGSAPGQFQHPWGVAVDPEYLVYVADELNHRIQKFDSKGDLLSCWGSYGTGESQFNLPKAVTLDSSGTL